MTSFEELMTSGESEEVPIVPGDAQSSYLFQQILPSQGVAEMPKGKPALDATSVSLIRKWITEGAANDSPPRNINANENRSPAFYSSVPPISAMDVSPDRTLLAVSGYHEVIIHDLRQHRKSVAASGSVVARLSGLSERIESIAFSPTGDRLAVAGGSPGRVGEIQIWDLESKELSFSRAAWHDCCFGVSWSPDGSSIAFGCPDNSVQVIESVDGKTVFTSRSHSDWVGGTTFSNSSLQLVTVSRDRTAKLFDISSQRFVTNLARFEANQSKIGLQAVARHPQRDEYLIGGTDRIARIYHTDLGEAGEIKEESNVIREFAAVPGPILEVQYSSDGQFVVVAGDQQGKGFAFVFEVDKPKVGIPMERIEGGIFTAKFLGNDTTVAAAGFDSIVYLNEAKSGKSVGKLAPFPRRR